MSNQLPRAFTRALVLALFVLTCFSAALAQTPSPTPVNPATQPPGQQMPPATAPPGTQPQNPQTPPGTNVVPTAQPTPVEPIIQEPRTPTFPDVQSMPIPPLPDLTRVGVVSSNVLTLSMNDAIRQALQNNNDIEVAKDDVRFAETQLRSLYGVYDPLFSVTPQIIKNVTPQTSSFLGGGGAAGTTSVTTFNVGPALTKSFEKGGGTYTLSFANSRTSTSSTNSSLSPFYSSNLSLQFSQPLLRNREIDANRRAIKVQKKRLEQTDSDFRQRTIAIISQVQAAYWNLVFALRNQQNQLDSLNLSRQNMKNIEAQISAGAKAPLDRAQVQTDIATRETNLFIATQNVSLAENSLKQLLLRDPSSPQWSAQITPTDAPGFDLAPVNLAASLEEARKNRPELRRLNLQKEITGIDIQYFKNQTKPQIDLTGTVAMTGLAGTPCTPNPADPTNRCTAPPANLVGGFGKDIRNLAGLNTYNVTVGAAISFPIHNTTARENLAGARIQRDQLEASYRSQDQAVEMDVRNAAQSVDTAQKRVVASRQARESAEQQLNGEQKLYEVGRSTTFLLLQRQNELTSARTSELQAQTDYNKALADLQRATAATLRINNVVVSEPTKP
ncbi:MAG TPA: TolC family protein [Pyrinomonadaceae bacterium]|nr:TolC family protein [Pyrinomonadaceae bacterium]